MLQTEKRNYRVAKFAKCHGPTIIEAATTEIFANYLKILFFKVLFKMQSEIAKDCNTISS